MSDSERLGQHLRERVLLLVGIDVIGDYLTEINVTSPTGIRAVKNVGGPDSAKLVWDKIEGKRPDRIVILLERCIHTKALVFRPSHDRTPRTRAEPNDRKLLVGLHRHPIVIVGAGGFAKGLAETLRAQDCWEIVGFTDKDPTPRSLVGIKVLGTDEILARLRHDGVTHAIVAVGDNRERQRIGRSIGAQGFSLANAISPSAAVSPSARLGVGLAILEGAVVNADATIGDFAIININASVSHDCVVGEAAHIAVGAAIPGKVRIGDRTLVGAGASAVPGVTIGTDVVIGAGAAVASDIPDGVTVVGVPARVTSRRPARLTTRRS